MTLLLGFLGACLATPGIRSLVEDIIVRLIISGDLFHSDADPAYRKQSLALMSQLEADTTEEEKRATLKAIQDLRKPSAPE